MKRLAFTLAALLAATAVHAAEWRTSWYAAPMPAWGAEFALPTMMPPSLEAQTVREVVRTSVGGEQVRVSYSNRYGSAPLVVGEVRLAPTRGEPSRAATSQQDGAGVQLTFGGQRSVTIAPGQTVTSDAAPLAVGARQRLSISTWLPQRSPLTTFHWGRSKRPLRRPATGPLPPSCRVRKRWLAAPS